MTDLARARYDAGESTATLAAEAGISRVQLWRRIGRPARYLMDPVAAGPVAAPSPMDVAWAAGFFDGEGYVGVVLRGSVSIVVAQTTRVPLDELARHFGGHVVSRPIYNPRHQPQWEWRVKGPRALSFLRMVRPHLRVKGAIADVGMVALSRLQKRGQRITPVELVIRHALYLEAKALNRRGRAEPST